MRRAYQKGGKVEGSIWHEQDVIPHGHPQRDANLTAFQKGNHPDVPHVAYHGTTNDFSKFNPLKSNAQLKRQAKAIFVSPDPELANKFAMPQFEEEGDVPNIMPVHVSAKNPFDYENPHHVARVIYDLSRDKDLLDMEGPHVIDNYKKQISEGDWSTIEDPWVQTQIKKRHDGFFAKGNGVKFLGVYNPKQIKSATGNNGHFDPTNSDITKADGGSVEPAIHPARLLSGVHIREEDYGHPVFTGSRHG